MSTVVTVEGTVTVEIDGVRHQRHVQLEAWADDDGADRNISVDGGDDPGTNAVFAATEVMADALRDALYSQREDPS